MYTCLCFRFFPTLKSYQDHVQLHQTNCNSIVAVSPEKLAPMEPLFSTLKIMERPKETKRGEQFHENAKSLTCPVCGKVRSRILVCARKVLYSQISTTIVSLVVPLLQVCTQQSALSNHMRTHEPKKFKCDICGRTFGLFIRLAAHRMSEHSKQPTMSPILSAFEQEEALNAEREAREAREARTRGIKRKSYSEVCLNSATKSIKIFNRRNLIDFCMLESTIGPPMSFEQTFGWLELNLLHFSFYSDAGIIFYCLCIV